MRRSLLLGTALPSNCAGDLYEGKSLSIGVSILFGILIAVLFFRFFALEGRLRESGPANGGGIAAVQASLKRVEAELAMAKELAPGLGEYMTTIHYMRENFGSPLKPRTGNWPCMSCMRWKKPWNRSKSSMWKRTA